jgi:NAD(P)-dependent dehydrogenase (short-subunit alcohol dehydrogenase family)
MDILGYKNKRVIVSGCFSGMGEATAKILLDLGAEVHGFDYKDASLPLASFTKVDLREGGHRHGAFLEIEAMHFGAKIDEQPRRRLAHARIAAADDNALASVSQNIAHLRASSPAGDGLRKPAQAGRIRWPVASTGLALVSPSS